MYTSAIELWEGKYRIVSFGKGAAFTITRVADGKSVSLQGDDAVQFDNELDALRQGMSFDRACEDYDEVLS